MTSPVQLPGFGAARDPNESARVRALARAAVQDTDVTILVTELACSEPGCPPTETVIALMYPGAPEQVKIHKPLRLVTAADVEQSLAARRNQVDDCG